MIFRRRNVRCTRSEISVKDERLCEPRALTCQALSGSASQASKSTKAAEFSINWGCKFLSLL